MAIAMSGLQERMVLHVTVLTEGYFKEELLVRKPAVETVILYGHKIRSLWRHFYQGANDMTSVVNSNDRNKVVDAKEEVNKLFEDEMGDAVVLAFAHTVTPSTATRWGKELTDVRKNEDFWWWHEDGAGSDGCCRLGQKPGAGSGCAGRGKADKLRGKGNKAGGGSVPPLAQ